VQAKQAAHASALEVEIAQQVLVEVESAESALELNHCQKVVVQVERHLEDLEWAGHLQTSCVVYSSEILGCLMPAIVLSTVNNRFNHYYYPQLPQRNCRK
jgi:hypothetical protein